MAEIIAPGVGTQSVSQGLLVQFLALAADILAIDRYCHGRGIRSGLWP